MAGWLGFRAPLHGGADPPPSLAPQVRLNAAARPGRGSRLLRGHRAASGSGRPAMSSPVRCPMRLRQLQGAPLFARRPHNPVDGPPTRRPVASIRGRRTACRFRAASPNQGTPVRAPLHAGGPPRLAWLSAPTSPSRGRIPPGSMTTSLRAGPAPNCPGRSMPSSTGCGSSSVVRAAKACSPTTRPGACPTSGSRRAGRISRLPGSLAPIPAAPTTSCASACPSSPRIEDAYLARLLGRGYAARLPATRPSSTAPKLPLPVRPRRARRARGHARSSGGFPPAQAPQSSKPPMAAPCPSATRTAPAPISSGSSPRPTHPPSSAVQSAARRPLDAYLEFCRDHRGLRPITRATYHGELLRLRCFLGRRASPNVAGTGPGRSRRLPHAPVQFHEPQGPAIGCHGPALPCCDIFTSTAVSPATSPAA